MSEQLVHSGGAETQAEIKNIEGRKRWGMRLGFASVLLLLGTIVDINVTARFGGNIERIWELSVRTLPVICAVSSVLAIVACIRHSKWWLLSAAFAAIIFWQWWQVSKAAI
jgi:hypothetical protein